MNLFISLWEQVIFQNTIEIEKNDNIGLKGKKGVAFFKLELLFTWVVK